MAIRRCGRGGCCGAGLHCAAGAGVLAENSPTRSCTAPRKRHRPWVWRAQREGRWISRLAYPPLFPGLCASGSSRRVHARAFDLEGCVVHINAHRWRKASTLCVRIVQCHLCGLQWTAAAGRLRVLVGFWNALRGISE